MSKTLTEIAQQLKAANKKVQLIYAFNGTGKTRLSREFKDLISPNPTLIGGGVPAISKHLKNIFDSGDLVEEVVISILETTTEHGAMPVLTQTKQGFAESVEK